MTEAERAADARNTAIDAKLQKEAFPAWVQAVGASVPILGGLWLALARAVLPYVQGAHINAVDENSSYTDGVRTFLGWPVPTTIPAMRADEALSRDIPWESVPQHPISYEDYIVQYGWHAQPKERQAQVQDLASKLADALRLHKQTGRPLPKGGAYLDFLRALLHGVALGIDDGATPSDPAAPGREPGREPGGGGTVVIVIGAGAAAVLLLAVLLGRKRS